MVQQLGSLLLLVRGGAQALMSLGMSLHLPLPRESERLKQGRLRASVLSPQPVCFGIQVADFLFRFNSEV